jgi:hypothetical protein
MASVKNVSAILSKMQNAGVPDAFGYDFISRWSRRHSKLAAGERSRV